MHQEYQIESVEKPEWTIIGGGIHQFNTQQAGDPQEQNLCFVLRSPEDEVVGGIIGATYWGWFYIKLMWIKEELRGQGYGHRLLTLAEEEARRRGAKKLTWIRLVFKPLASIKNMAIRFSVNSQIFLMATNVIF